MTNEWLEFQAYTKTPVYKCEGKRDLSFLGRFTLQTLTEYDGMGRILTIIARGYLFHGKEGNILKEDPYDRIEYARKALCSWCSVPDKNKSSEPQIDFGNLSDEFPELVNEKGEGWFYRHVKQVISFTKKNEELVSKKTAEKVAELSKNFTRSWSKKVRQLQVPLFALNTKLAWTLRFDDIIADALELGPLCCKMIIPPPELLERIPKIELPGDAPLNVIFDVVSYIVANRKSEDSFVVLPVANFDCYYRNTNFSKKYISKLPKNLIQREVSNGVCRVKIV